MLVGIIGSASAQRDDLYFVPKKKTKVEATAQTEAPVEETVASSSQESEDERNGLAMDEDAYNRRWSYLTEEGDAVSEFAQGDGGFLLITEEGDTMWTDADTLRLTRVANEKGWVNGFDGSDADYEYAMRIIRFRNPRYAIPVSSPLYWDVVYGGSLWPSWDWNIYADGMYAYVFPTRNNWHYWDYMMNYPLGWSPWGGHWGYSYGYGHPWGWHYGWDTYGFSWYLDPWNNPWGWYGYHHGYYPGWHHGLHHGFYPGVGVGKPGWGGPKAFPNDRKSTVASTRRGTQSEGAASRGSSATSATRRGTAVTRTDNGATRSSSVRVITDRTGSTSRSSGVVRSSGTSRTGNDEIVRRSSGSSSVSRGATTGSSSRSSYTRQSTSRSSSGSSYNRPSSTRSSSSSVSRSSSSSRSGSYSSGSSSSSRSSSYSGGSSYSGSSSRSSGSSFSGGSRSGSSSSGSRR